MNSYKRNKSSMICLLLLCTIAIAGISCKKIEPQKFSADSFVYFVNQFGTPGSTSMIYLNKPVVTFSFIIPTYQKDTVVTNLVTALPLSVQFDGRVADHNRKIKIELEGDGKEFCILPPEDSMYIPANGIEYKLNFKIARPPLSDTSIKTVTLKLRNTADFSPEKHTWHTISYRFGNWFDVASTYVNVEAVYGAFSPAKMFTMQTAVYREGPAFWNADPGVTVLNNFLANVGQKPIRFNDFTFDQLYNFIDYPLTYLQYYEYSGGPATDAYNALSAKIVALSKALVVEKREAGEPILDASGNEITFP